MSPVSDTTQGATEPQNQYPFVEKRSMPPCSDHETRIRLIEQTDGQTQRTMEQVSTKLDLILAQITKIALLEQKHDVAAVDITRAHAKIGEVAKDVEILAKETRAFIAYSQGRDKVLWAIGATVLGLVIKALFFAAHNGMTP